MQKNTQSSSSILSKLYREFSKQKFNTYRLKFPKLKEAEITKKVMKEWEDLDPKSRKELEEQYRKKNFLKEDREALTQQFAGFKVAGNVPTKKKVEAPAIGKDTAKEAIARKVLPQESSGDVQESRSFKASESIVSSQDNLPRTKKIRKTKKDIKQLPNSQYLQFFKFYYGRLCKEHPRWSPLQRTKIIKLLWRKRRIQKVRSARERKQTVLARKPARPVRLTAYTCFLKQKLESNRDVDPKDIRREARMIWRKLTRAGKHFYEKQAKQHNESIPLGAATKEKKPMQITALMKLTI